MRILGILLCLTALGLTGYSALTYKAPQIEADIEEKTRWALSDLGGDDIQVHVDGRHVTLKGHITSSEQRQDILSAVASVSGALGPIDQLKRQDSVSPYRFDAVKEEDGTVVVEGFAPTTDAKAIIETDAKALFGDDVRITINVAEGAPSSDWSIVATTALDALATTRQGRLTIVDSNVALDGDVAARADIDAIDIFAESVPEGYSWAGDIGLSRQTVDPFVFSVVKGADGSLLLNGYAPDEATRDAFVEEGKAVSGDERFTADIQVADGMPDQEWPSLVHAGISAMRDMEAGRFDVIDNDVSFSSNLVTSKYEGQSDNQVATDKAPTESSEGLDTSADVQATGDDDTSVDAAVSPEAVETEARLPVLTVDKAEEGAWSIRGSVPDQDTKDTLVSTVETYAGVRDIDVELELTGSRPDENWLRFFDDHIRTLDVVRAGRLHLEDDRAHLIGVVDTPEDVEPVEQALAAIDETMTVDLQPVDPRPLASLDLNLSPDAGITLNGTLPGTLTEGDVLLALGIRNYEGKLDSNGRGSVETWRENLTAIGAFLPAFEDLDVSLDNDRPKVKGRIDASGDADAVARKIVLALSSDRQPLVDIEPSTTPRNDGDQRTNPLTRNEEVYRQGYWLPVIDIAADEDACRERSSAMLASDKITFLRGEDDLDERAQTTLNALAALAIACLDDTELMLEIGGHTDSRGAARMNQELSQARADAVLQALTARGVDATSLIAVGYGDDQPIADNSTDEGRSANRRITFEWKPLVDLKSSGVEG